VWSCYVCSSCVSCKPKLSHLYLYSSVQLHKIKIGKAPSCLNLKPISGETSCWHTKKLPQKSLKMVACIGAWFPSSQSHLPLPDGLLLRGDEWDRQMGYCHMEVNEIVRWVIGTWRWRRSPDGLLPHGGGWDCQMVYCHMEVDEIYRIGQDILTKMGKVCACCSLYPLQFFAEVSLISLV
jgi:hypothetical protein